MKYRLYWKVAALLAAIAVVSLGLTALTVPVREEKTQVRIVTSFYPVYIAALNVANGASGVEVVNMVDSQTGCLHDYQMSPADRAVLESADVFVMNGAGAEPFLEAALETLPELAVVDLSVGQSLLESGHVHTHDHGGGHEEHEDVHGGSYNSHLWVSPLRYRQQIETLATALTAADPANGEIYTANAAAYIQKIDAVWERLKQAAAAFADTPAMLFHDSLAYVAEDLSLTVTAALNVGEESGVSAAQLAAAEDALTGLPKAMFFYDAQYEAVQYTYLQDLPQTAVCLTVDTAVAGEDDPDAWLRAMTAFCEAWEAAV